LKPAGHLAVVLFFVSAAVQADPVTDCNEEPNPSRRINGCSQVISQTMMGETLSVAYMNRGIAYAEQNKPSKALADFSSSIDANKANGIAYYNRGNIYFDLRKLQHAAADYSKAIELEPDMDLAFLNRALVNEKLGAREASISDYRAALALDPMLFLASAGLKRLGAPP
jgi:tetratricopeptide (TPR) repeat protein